MFDTSPRPHTDSLHVLPSNLVDSHSRVLRFNRFLRKKKKKI